MFRLAFPVFLFLVSNSIAIAGTTPSVPAPAQDAQYYRTQADSQVQTANQLTANADSLLKENVTREKMQLALSLYVQAGQLFEQAGNMYRALGPQLVTQTEVENSYAAMQRCIQNIQELKKRLG